MMKLLPTSSGERIYLLCFGFVLLNIIILKAYPLFLSGCLPGGDAIASIQWANQIIDTQNSPDYSVAWKFNEDPADSYTPGLHILTAITGMFAGNIIKATAFVTVLEAVALALMAYAIAWRLTGNRMVSTLAMFFQGVSLISGRYTNIVGTHFQNIFGEILVLMSLYFLLTAIHSNKISNYIAFLIPTLSVLIFHQLSSFVLLCILIVTAPIIVASKWENIHDCFLKGKRKFFFGAVLLLSVFVSFQFFFPFLKNQSGFLFGIVNKNSPLVGNIPSINEYLAILGLIPVYISLIGVFFLVRMLIHDPGERINYVFLLIWSALILFLSQGPRFYIDVDPTRALYYIAVPIGILCALAIHKIIEYPPSITSRAVLVIALAVTIFTAQNTDYVIKMEDTIAKPPETYSQMTDEIYRLINWFENNTPSDSVVLIDYYGQRNLEGLRITRTILLRYAGWRINLFKKRMMQAAGKRKEMYANNLEIYEVFKDPTSRLNSAFLEKYNISYICTVKGKSSPLFENIPLLEPVAETSNIIVYKVKKG